jgi:hypothetical protein
VASVGGEGGGKDEVIRRRARAIGAAERKRGRREGGSGRELPVARMRRAGSAKGRGRNRPGPETTDACLRKDSLQMRRTRKCPADKAMP